MANAFCVTGRNGQSAMNLSRLLSFLCTVFYAFCTIRATTCIISSPTPAPDRTSPFFSLASRVCRYCRAGIILYIYILRSCIIE